VLHGHQTADAAAAAIVSTGQYLGSAWAVHSRQRWRLGCLAGGAAIKRVTPESHPARMTLTCIQLHSHPRHPLPHIPASIALALSTVSLPHACVVICVTVVITYLPQADLAPLPKVLKEAEDKERQQQQQQQQLGEHAMDLDPGPTAAPAAAKAAAKPVAVAEVLTAEEKDHWDQTDNIIMNVLRRWVFLENDVTTGQPIRLDLFPAGGLQHFQA